jgi:hypothetical protein
MIASVISHGFSIYYFSTSLRRYATTRVSSPPSFVSTSLVMFFSMLVDFAFPILVLLILRHDAVARFWARDSGGFEEVPFARQTDDLKAE